MTRAEELELLIAEQRKDDTSVASPEPHKGLSLISLDSESNTQEHSGGLPSIREDYLVGEVYDFDAMIESGDYEAPGEVVGFIDVRPSRGYVMRQIRHGTTDGYGNRGCRCALCKRAFADYMLAYTHRTGRRKPMQQHLAEIRERAEARPHGTTSKYHGGCRCDKCRAASAAAKRSYRQRRSA